CSSLSCKVKEDDLFEEEALLQEMAEEDEEIDLYNEETFGLDIDSVDENSDLVSLLCDDLESKPFECSTSESKMEAQAPKPEALVIEKPQLEQEAGATAAPEPGDVPPQQQEQQAKVAQTEVKVRKRRCEEQLDDPAVMKAVHGRPTLESLDSAIVDSGLGSNWNELEMDHKLAEADSSLWTHSPRLGQTLLSCPVFEDKAVLDMMKSVPLLDPQIPPLGLDFLTSPLAHGYLGPSILKQPDIQAMSPKPFNQQLFQQMQRAPMIPHTPTCPLRLFTPPPRALPLFPAAQSSGYVSPTPFRSMSPNIHTPIQSGLAEMLQMRFGPITPGSKVPQYFSPSPDLLQRFRFPGHVTQLHPQHKRLLSQRQQRLQSSQRKVREMRFDPFANLMSQKEKDWIIKVQMIQLQSENPHLDDYYYQSYYEKLERKMAEEEQLSNRAKREPQKLTTPYVQKTESYEPVVHIEGSLGQVAVSTCYSPRRAIDAVHAAMSEEDIKALGHQRLRVLNSIEKMFLMLLETEDMERKLTVLPEKEKSRFREKCSKKVQDIYEMLQVGQSGDSEDETEDEFLQFLSVAKGKKLVCRLLLYLQHKEAVEILLAVTRHLPFLFKKDLLDEEPDSCSALPPYLKLILVGRLLIPLSFCFGRHVDLCTLNTFDGFSLFSSCLQFGISLLYALLSHGERVLSSEAGPESSIGDFDKWTEMIFLVAKEMSQVSKSSMVEPFYLPSNLLSLFCRYLDKPTVHHLEDKIECPPLLSCPAVPL
uniref:PAT1 homolog 2 n=1 Tax=Latimeria chalumnae TaxID=7897 RepID=H3A8J0_LATCH